MIVLWMYTTDVYPWLLGFLCLYMYVYMYVSSYLYIKSLFSFFQSTESKSFVMGLFKGKLNVQQVFPFPEGMCLSIFTLYPFSRYTM